MKFTKEQCLEQIQAVLGQTKLTSDRSILENLDTLIPLISNDEMELKDFIEKVSPSFKTMEANLKHEQTIFAKEFSEKHAPKPPVTPPIEKPVDTPSVPQPATLTMESLMEAIQLANKPLNDRLAAMDKEAAIRGILSGVDSISKSWGVNPSRAGLLDLAKEMTFSNVSESDTPEGVAELLKGNYEKIVKASGSDDGYVPKDGSGGDSTRLDLKRKIESLTASNSGVSVMDALGLNK